MDHLKRAATRSGEPIVSVGVPTLNRSGLLGGALRSVLSQSHRDVRITVVDNGSVDGTADLIRGLTDPRVDLIRNDLTIPRTENYNIALSAGAGRFVAILADDDEWMPEFISRAVAVLESYPDVALVHTGYEVVDGRDDLLYVVENPAPHGETVVSGYHYIQWVLGGDQRIEFTATVLRRDAVPAGGFRPKDDVADDLGLLLRMATRGQVAFINEPLARIRLHEGTVSAAGSTVGFQDRYRLSLAYRARCREAKLRFLEEYAHSLPESRRLRRMADRSLRRHLLVPTARAFRSRSKILEALHSAVTDTAYDRWCLAEPEAWKWAAAAYLGRES